jgi:hypothetical protein
VSGALSIAAPFCNEAPEAVLPADVTDSRLARICGLFLARICSNCEQCMHLVMKRHFESGSLDQLDLTPYWCPRKILANATICRSCSTTRYFSPLSISSAKSLLLCDISVNGYLRFFVPSARVAGQRATGIRQSPPVSFCQHSRDTNATSLVSGAAAPNTAIQSLTCALRGPEVGRRNAHACNETSRFSLSPAVSETSVQAKALSRACTAKLIQVVPIRGHTLPGRHRRVFTTLILIILAAL